MSTLRRLALILLMLAWPTSAALAQVGDSAQVHVRITVAPSAQVTFPQGTGFQLVVRPPLCAPFGWVGALLAHDHHHYYCPLWMRLWWPPVEPVRIPFIVHGNTPVSVTVIPSAFIRTRFGVYLGRATRGDGAPLAYNLIVHFPAPTAAYHWLNGWNDEDHWWVPLDWSGFGRLPIWSHVAELQGTEGNGTTPLRADLTARGGVAYGFIYIVAGQFWWGTGAWPGVYFGDVNVAVTPSP